MGFFAAGCFPFPFVAPISVEKKPEEREEESSDSMDISEAGSILVCVFDARRLIQITIQMDDGRKGT
jgi:hypothetical protein